MNVVDEDMDEGKGTIAVVHSIAKAQGEDSDSDKLDGIQVRKLDCGVQAISIGGVSIPTLEFNIVVASAA